MSRLFPFIYDRVMEPLERKSLRRLRKRLISEAEGNVLEVGSGTGVNFPFYPQDVTVTAIEPDPKMAEKSEKRIAVSRAGIQLLLAKGEMLPFPANSFDTAVGTLVFCTISDPERALLELRRVLKPNGKLLLLEHVKMEQPFLAAIQNTLTPAWKVVCGGCHLNRDTLRNVVASGFKVASVDQHHKGLFLMIKAENDKHSFAIKEE